MKFHRNAPPAWPDTPVNQEQMPTIIEALADLKVVPKIEVDKDIAKQRWVVTAMFEVPYISLAADSTIDEAWQYLVETAADQAAVVKQHLFGNKVNFQGHPTPGSMVDYAAKQTVPKHLLSDPTWKIK